MTTDIDLNTYNTIRNQCRSKFNAPQIVEAIDSKDVYFKDINQTNNLFNTCIQGSDLFQETKAKVDQKSAQDIKITQKATGLDISAILNSMALPLAIVGIVVVVFLVYTGVGGGGSGNGSESGGGSGLGTIVVVIVALVIVGMVAYLAYLYINGDLTKTEIKCDPVCLNKGTCKEDPNDPEKGICECKGNYTGAQCKDCKIGWKGEDCNSCVTGYTGENCDKCVTGFEKSGNLCIRKEAVL